PPPRPTPRHPTRGYFPTKIAPLTKPATVAQSARSNHGTRQLAVASGGARPIVEACLKATHLFDLFDRIVTIEDVAHPKPAPDLFLKAAQLLNTAPTRCFVFEDTQSGLDAAHAAGMRCIDVAQIIPPA
ncbi:MAG: HAD family phosphatase, partial [Komagataeibacter saccharivorans]|uniref:HAD family hydrolase n=1 Tax=Komagataeibacter saccharivorans TaxID=265959 RepID=UPI0039E7A633